MILDLVSPAVEPPPPKSVLRRKSFQSSRSVSDSFLAANTRLPSFSKGGSSDPASLRHLAIQEDSVHSSNKVMNNLFRGNITVVPVLIEPVSGVFHDSKEDALCLATMAPDFSNP
jgi:hypothetical protein